MDDLEIFISKRKAKDKKFAKDFEEGYENFKIGALLKQDREEAGVTHKELSKKLRLKNQQFRE